MRTGGLQKHRTRIAVAVVLAALGVVLFLALGGHGGGGLFSYDRNRPLDAQLSPLPSIADDDVKAVSYAGDGGDHVPGLLALPRGETAGPCVIYMHGLGGTKEDAVPLVAPLGKLGIGLLATLRTTARGRTTLPSSNACSMRRPVWRRCFARP